jgi:hypothetical protein
MILVWVDPSMQWQPLCHCNSKQLLLGIQRLSSQSRPQIHKMAVLDKPQHLKTPLCSLLGKHHPSRRILGCILQRDLPFHYSQLAASCTLQGTGQTPLQSGRFRT